MRGAPDRPRHRLAALPDQIDQQRYDDRDPEIGQEMHEVAVEAELLQQLDGREDQRPDDRDPHDPPIEEPGGRIVDRKDPQGPGVRRQQRAGHQRDQPDGEDRADPGHDSETHRAWPWWRTKNAPIVASAKTTMPMKSSNRASRE